MVAPVILANSLAVPVLKSKPGCVYTLTADFICGGITQPFYFPVPLDISAGLKVFFRKVFHFENNSVFTSKSKKSVVYNS